MSRSHAETPFDLSVRHQAHHTLADTQGGNDAGKNVAELSFGVVASALIVILVGAALAQSSNSEVGNWKLNIAKSTFSPGRPGLKSGTVKTDVAGAGVKVIVDAVSDDGTAYHYELTSNYDGKNNPVVGQHVYGTMVSSTRINANTTKSIFKNAGKITTTLNIVVSSDGKTQTVTATGRMSRGSPSTQ
jgi:hypothetical protein